MIYKSAANFLFTPSLKDNPVLSENVKFPDNNERQKGFAYICPP